MIESLIKVEYAMREHFEIRDWQGVRIILAVAVAHNLSGEMIWMRTIGGSGTGRTELLRPIEMDLGSTNLDVLTPATLRGGLRGGHKILDRISGKLVITMDLATILTANKAARLEIFGTLRRINDGRIVSDFGTMDTGTVDPSSSDAPSLVQSGWFDWILATTPAIEVIRQIESLLGERYVDLQWRPADRERVAYQAALNNPELPDIREEVYKIVSELLRRGRELAKEQQPPLSNEELGLISKYASVSSLCRSPVVMRNNILMSMPNPEYGTRLAQSFSRIVRGLKLLQVDDWQSCIRRLTWDCIPSVRNLILKTLQKEGQLTVDKIYADTKIPKNTVYYFVNELLLLGVVKKEGEDVKLLVELPPF